MRRPTESQTLLLLVVLAVVFLVQSVLGEVLGRPAAVSLFALSAPVTERPWTILTSVYSHWDVQHLLANAVGLLVAGVLVERHTTARKFQAYVLLTGIAAALSEVLVAITLGPTLPWITQNVAVMGISGSVMALIGYLLASNTVTTAVVGRVSLSPRAQLLIVVVVAAVITYVTAGPRVAMIAHFVGLVLGLIAGHQRLLRV